MAEILRRGRLGPQPADVSKYTSSVASDKYIVEPVIRINQAHVVMLVEEGIINPRDGALILKALNELDPHIRLDPRLEDVHMNVEARVIRKVGEAVGGKLHTGKSRNDQVSAAIRMTLRKYVLDLAEALIQLRRVILEICHEHLETVMPGYTHLQHAQPVTLAHHLLAYHDAFQRDTHRLMDTYHRINVSPMGAVALATTSFRINRERIAELLGFDGLVENSMDAVSTRDFAVEALAAMTLIMNNLSRMAKELILWSTHEIRAVEIPDEYASTSSIMPQKKNPVVLELIRARAAHVYGDLSAVTTILHALPLSYNLDLQEINPRLWSSCEATLSSIKMMRMLLPKLKFKKDRLLELATRNFSTATDLADILVRELDIPFRTSHHIVGLLVRKLLAEDKTLEDLTPEELSEALEEVTGSKGAINWKKLTPVLHPKKSVSAKTVIGGPAPRQVKKATKRRQKQVKEDEAWYRQKIAGLKKADEKLKAAVKKICK